MVRVKNSTLVIGLSIGLGITLITIVFLLWNKNKKDNHPARLMYPMRSPQNAPTPSSHVPPTPQPQENKPCLVLFHASWCHNCTAMMPAWQQAKQTLAQIPQLQVLDFEDKSHKDLMRIVGIKGFPSIRFYPQGLNPNNPNNQNFIEYRGNRSTESLINFARSGGQQV